MSAGGRDTGLDALRASLTLLVLFHHTAITYGGDGAWYYKEVAGGSGLDARLLSLFAGINQAFFMGLFFLLAGYFTPRAAARQGAAAYARERLLRLGVPLVVYWLVLSPLTIALAATARGRDFGVVFARVWMKGGMESGPLWFCQALLMFAALYLAVRAMTPRLPAISAFPSNAALALAAVATGAAAFMLRLIWPTGATVLNMQPGYFASYVVLFAAGCLAASWPSLDAAPEPQRRLWRRIAWVTLPILPIAVALGAHVPALAGSLSGGFNLQALVYAFWEPFLAWGIIIALIHGYTTRLTAPGPIWRALSRRAYAIYVIHPPVLVGVALAWRTVAAPPAVKFVVTGIATCLASFGIAGLLLRLPGVKRIL